MKVPLGTEPKYQRVSRPGKLGKFKEELVRALKADAHRPRRNRRTALALFDTIKTNGYAGGYTAVTDFIRGWHESSGHAVTRAFVPLQFEPGEAHQFDWSEEHLMIGGVRKGHCDAKGYPRMWSGSSAVTSNAGSSPTVSPALSVSRVNTTS